MKYEVEHNDKLKEVLFCQNSVLNYSKDAILSSDLFINNTENTTKRQSAFSYNQQEEYKDCTPIMKNLAIQSENILYICVLYIIVYLGLQLYFNKNFRDGVIYDLRRLNCIIEGLLKFEKISEIKSKFKKIK